MGSGIFVYIMYRLCAHSYHRVPNSVTYISSEGSSVWGSDNVLDASAKDINDLAQKNCENFLYVKPHTHHQVALTSRLKSASTHHLSHVQT